MDSVKDDDSAAFGRFVDKNKVFQREREIAVEQAIVGANKRYMINVDRAQELDSIAEEKMEKQRSTAV